MILAEVEKIKKYAVISNSETISKDEKGKKEIIVDIRKQLLLLYNGAIIQKNIDALEKLIKLRLENRIDKDKFVNQVTKPLLGAGAGFNRRTAERFSRELELLMLIKFGEESNNKMMVKN